MVDKKKGKVKARGKYGVYTSYLEFESIRTYLRCSINSKGKKVKIFSTFEEKLQNSNLYNYLSGVKKFFEEYCVVKEYKHNDPYKLLAHYKDIKNDPKELGLFIATLDDYAVWITSMGLKGAATLQGHVRGFLNRNGAELKMRNYQETTSRMKTFKKYGITITILKKMGDKIIEYVSDHKTQLLCKWLRISGLRLDEITRIQFEDIRYKRFDKSENYYKRLDKFSGKTGDDWTSFVYSDVENMLLNHVRKNEDKEDEDYIFGNKITTIKDNMRKIFNRAYDKMIENDFPEFKDITVKKYNKKTKEIELVPKRLFTFHIWRHIFTTICEKLRIPPNVVCKFKSTALKGTDKSYLATELEEEEYIKYFAEIQDALFGRHESTTRTEIKKEIYEEIMENLMNSGKRKSILKTYEAGEELNIKEATNDVKLSYLISNFFKESKKDALNDHDYLWELANHQDFVDKLCNNNSFINGLLDNQDFLKSLKRKMDNL